MSYGPPQGGYPGYPPQGGYQQPPPGQYPPSQGQYPPQQQVYPPQGGYPPHGGHSPAPQQGYPPPHQQGYPPQGYPPQQQQQQPPYGAQPHSPYPPQQGYPPPQQQPPYGGQQQGQYPPQQPYNQQYGQPPPPQQGGYGGPPPPHQQQQGYGGPPQAPYGAPPPQPYGAPPVQPTPPSPGYNPNQVANIDMSMQADACRKAMKGFGTNEALLIQTICPLGPLEIPALKTAFHQRHHRDLAHDVESEVSGHFETTLLAVLRGPLMQDVHSLGKALHGAGTDEVLLNDVLIGRSNADLNAIKAAYHHHYHRSLETDVANDLSMLTQRMFAMILSATRQEDSAQVLPQNVDADVSELHRATEARHGADQLTVCSILTNRSDGQIRALAHAYEAKFRIPLEQMLKREFSGHMEMALVQMVRCGADRIMRDAVALEDTMAGVGTKDNLLVVRMVRCHWDRRHMQQVKAAYRQRYRGELATRVKGETSGWYEKSLLALLE